MVSSYQYTTHVFYLKVGKGLGFVFFGLNNPFFLREFFSHDHPAPTDFLAPLYCYHTARRHLSPKNFSLLGPSPPPTLAKSEKIRFAFRTAFGIFSASSSAGGGVMINQNAPIMINCFCFGHTSFYRRSYCN